jgi:putative component of toxin-antitoxin plasmid stabilization module
MQQWTTFAKDKCASRDSKLLARICYAQYGVTLILLLCGGTKRTQDKDIEKAHAYWKDYKARTG